MQYRSFSICFLAILLSACSHGTGITPPVGGGSSRPQVVHRDTVGWTSFDIGGFAYALVLGHDGFMYAATDGQSVTKIDPITHQLTRIALNGSAVFSLAPNSDGNVYTAEIVSNSIALVRITPDGRTIEIPLPSPQDRVLTLVTGSDHRLWMIRSGANGLYAAAVTTHGQYTSFPTIIAGQVNTLVPGPDRNVWGWGIGDDVYVRFSIVDGSPTEFSTGVFGIAEGPDQKFWGPATHRNIASFDPATQQTTYYPVHIQTDFLNGAFVKKNFCWVDRGYLYAFNITKAKVVSRIPTPAPASVGYSYAGPNHQLWDMDLYPGTVIYVYQF